TLLIGNGVGSFPSLPGSEYEGHSLLVLSITEYGIIGTMLFSLFWLACLASSRFYSVELQLMSLIAGLSFWPHAAPFLYASLALTILLGQALTAPDQAQSLRKGDLFDGRSQC